MRYGQIEVNAVALGTRRRSNRCRATAERAPPGRPGRRPSGSSSRSPPPLRPPTRRPRPVTPPGRAYAATQEGTASRGRSPRQRSRHGSGVHRPPAHPVRRPARSRPPAETWRTPVSEPRLGPQMGCGYEGGRCDRPARLLALLCRGREGVRLTRPYPRRRHPVRAGQPPGTGRMAARRGRSVGRPGAAGIRSGTTASRTRCRSSSSAVRTPW